jgi:hypothetical protein
MTSPLGGRPTKDQSITDNFNPVKTTTLTRKERAEIARQKRTALIARKRIGELADAGAKELAKVEKDLKANVARVREEVGVTSAQIGAQTLKANHAADTESDETLPVPPGPLEEEKSAHKMLADLRYAYARSVGPTGKKGKARLVELLENDSEFKFAVKELVKVDTALLAAKIRNKEDEQGMKVGQQNFFVVLKGLDDGPVKSLGCVVDKTVDMKQIARALNPDENSYVAEDEDRSRNEAPEMLLGRVDNEDNEEIKEGTDEEGVDAW